MNDAPAYGLWSLVIINSLVFIIFAFSFAKPRSPRDWRSAKAAASPKRAFGSVMSTPSETMDASSNEADALPLHVEATCEVRAQASSVFEYIDQPQRLSAHMARRSWQLGGASMVIETDAEGGRAVGSHIRLAGRMLGIPLYVEGQVVQREPPNLKAWETVSEPHLLVIGRYRMRVNIEARGDLAHVTIAIDYARPANTSTGWLGMLFGPLYARWCVRQMAQDLIRQFGTGK